MFEADSLSNHSLYLFSYCETERFLHLHLLLCFMKVNTGEEQLCFYSSSIISHYTQRPECKWEVYLWLIRKLGFLFLKTDVSPLVSPSMWYMWNAVTVSSQQRPSLLSLYFILTTVKCQDAFWWQYEAIQFKV